MTNKQELLAGGLERVSQAAKRLSIDPNTLYHWIHEGRIPYLQVHGVYRIPTLAVDEMLVTGLKMGSSESHATDRESVCIERKRLFTN